jgi:hypothetical protein
LSNKSSGIVSANTLNNSLTLKGISGDFNRSGYSSSEPLRMVRHD